MIEDMYNRLDTVPACDLYFGNDRMHAYWALD